MMKTDGDISLSNFEPEIDEIFRFVRPVWGSGRGQGGQDKDA